MRPAMNRLYAMDTHFMCANEGPSPKEQAELVKSIGFENYYVTGSINNIDRFEHYALASRSAGIEINAAFESIDILSPFTRTHLAHTERVLQLLPSHGRIELALTAGGFGSHVGNHELDDHAVEWLDAITDLLEQEKREVSLYPHFGFYLETFEDALRVARKISSAWVRVIFTSYHWFHVQVHQGHRQPSSAQLFAEAGDLLNAVNLCGSSRLAGPQAESAPLNPSIAPLDEGDADVASMVSELIRIGFTGPIGVQGYAVTAPAKDALARSHEMLRRMLACRP